MDITSFLQLNKPGDNDYITDDKLWKDNPDKIDSQFYNHDTRLGAVESGLSQKANQTDLDTVSSSLAELMQQQAPVTPTSVKIANGKKKTIYLWQFTWVQTQPDAIVSNLVSENITDIFIQWSTTITTAQWQYFIGACSAKGISVWALDGDESWITTPSYGTTDINNVIAYNNSVSANQKFVGVHFDVEPSAADQSSSTTLQTWYQNHVTWATQCHQNGLLFAGSFQKAMTTLTTSYGVNNPNSKPFYQLLIDVVDLFVMMDYTTNTTTAENNIAPAINYATSPKVILGIETTNVTPSSITFYSSGYAAANSALTTYDGLYTSNVGYAGVSIHDYEQWSAFLIAIKVGNNGFISVKDSQFGAKGDGTTDDTVALTNAFALANSLGSAVLWIPAGTYIMSSSIRLYKNTTIYCDPNVVIKRTGSDYKTFYNGAYGNMTYATGYNGDGNIHWHGGTLDLNQANRGLSTTTGLIAFDIGHADNVSFHGLKVINGQGGHYFEISSSKNVRFKDCYFGNQVWTDTTDPQHEVIQIEAMTSSSFPAFGSYDDTLGRDVWIEDCTFENVIRAIGNHATNVLAADGVTQLFSENVHITGCIFKTIQDNAVELCSFKDSFVKNNYFNGCVGFPIYMNNANNNIIEGNTIVKSQMSGIYLKSIQNNTFRDNIIRDSGLATSGLYSAIRVYTASNNVFDNNTVSATGTAFYSYSLYFSDTSTGNKILSHNFTVGTSGAMIGGANDTEKANYMIGGGQVTLFDGDLSAANATGALSYDVRNFSFIVVVANDYTTSTAYMVSKVITKSELTYAGVAGQASRFRIVTGDSTTDHIDFSFDTTYKNITVNVLSGACHIRRVIGVI